MSPQNMNQQQENRNVYNIMIARKETTTAVIPTVLNRRPDHAMFRNLLRMYVSGYWHLLTGNACVR